MPCSSADVRLGVHGHLRVLGSTWEYFRYCCMSWKTVSKAVATAGASFSYGRSSCSSSSSRQHRHSCAWLPCLSCTGIASWKCSRTASAGLFATLRASPALTGHWGRQSAASGVMSFTWLSTVAVAKVCPSAQQGVSCLNIPLLLHAQAICAHAALL
jgi:hypothetical protein